MSVDTHWAQWTLGGIGDVKVFIVVFTHLVAAVLIFHLFELWYKAKHDNSYQFKELSVCLPGADMLKTLNSAWSAGPKN